MDVPCLIFVLLYMLANAIETAPIFSKESDVNKTFSPEVILSRRRGLTPNFRRRGDVGLLSQIGSTKVKADMRGENRNARENRKTTDNLFPFKSPKRNYNDLVNKIKYSGGHNPHRESTRSNGKTDTRLRHRKRRWDYDENYDWENGGKDYVIPGQEPKPETKLEKFAKSWQKHALKVIFIFSIACMICCCCVAICKKFCSKVCETICWHLKDYRDICLRRDPAWRKARKFADDYGIDLDYNQFKQIKKNYEDGFKRQGLHEYGNLTG